MNINIEHISSLILITGVSGAGKSSVLHALADLGYYTVDNLPVSLLKTFLEFSNTHQEKFRNTALLLDVYSEDEQQELLAIFKELRNGHQENIDLLFIDCNTDTILKRYSETRRPHPAFVAGKDSSLIETINTERNRLILFKELATFVLDTSNLNIHALRRKVREFIDNKHDTRSTTLTVSFISFGFKNGTPRGCDLIADVRFIPNPYFIEGLRKQCGLDEPVRDFVLNQETTIEFINRYTDLLKFLLPHYVFEGKAYLSIGIGCTGGKHRSVAIAEELAKRLADPAYLITVQHRDLQIEK